MSRIFIQHCHTNLACNTANKQTELFERNRKFNLFFSIWMRCFMIYPQGLIFFCAIFFSSICVYNSVKAVLFKSLILSVQRVTHTVSADFLALYNYVSLLSPFLARNYVFVSRIHCFGFLSLTLNTNFARGMYA